MITSQLQLSLTTCPNTCLRIPSYQHDQLTTARPKDYEYHLKKWGYRQNLHANELQFILHQLKAREQAGKRSEILISGKTWPLATIEGKATRHKLLPTSAGKYKCAAHLDHLAIRLTDMISAVPSFRTSRVPGTCANSVTDDDGLFHMAKRATMARVQRLLAPESTISAINPHSRRLRKDVSEHDTSLHRPTPFIS